MKTVSLILPAVLAIALLAACEEESRPRIRHNNPGQTGSNNFGYNTEPTPGTATEFVTDAAPTPTPIPSATDAPGPGTYSTAPTPAPSGATAVTTTTTSTQSRDLQFGTPVAGKPGFVTSPYAPYAGFVDVRGFPPNTEVKDPFSGKIFLVP